MARKRTSKPARPKSSRAHRAPSPPPNVVPIDPYLERLTGRHRDIIEAFRKLARKVDADVAETLDWGLPVYKNAGGRVCYLKSFPTHVQLGFWQGASLPDPDSLLRGRGDTMRHVRLRRTADVESKSLRALLRAAFTQRDE